MVDELLHQRRGLGHIADGEIQIECQRVVLVWPGGFNRQARRPRLFAARGEDVAACLGRRREIRFEVS